MYTIDLDHVSLKDIAQVGGKNASLGEMLQGLSNAHVLVPKGFATTADAFYTFLKNNNLDNWIYDKLTSYKEEQNLEELTKLSEDIQNAILKAPFSAEFEESVRKSYKELIQKIGIEVSVAVRSSATAEDLPNASFAGQQETYLNIFGIDAILIAIKKVFASLFLPRAISYRIHNGFSHHDVAISVGIQQMVRSDLGSSGVMFTMDTESGFDDVVFITAAFGLGETVVQGAVNPDEFYVHKKNLKLGKPAILRRHLGSKATKMIYNENQNSDESVCIVDVDNLSASKFSLNTKQIEDLAKLALLIEEHYKRPMDIEWALDGLDKQLYILQARPETVKSRENTQKLERFQLNESGPMLCRGRSIGSRIGRGRARVITDVKELNSVEPGDVLITDMTDPDWEPIMKRASAIVTNRGGRTCHAAIIARELGIPAVVGCGEATRLIKNNTEVTVSCAEGDIGYVYEGLLSYDCISVDVDNRRALPIEIMLNVGNPERAFLFQSIPNAGVGLARLEFLISNLIGIHPNALLEFESLEDEAVKKIIKEKTAAYDSPVEYYIERLKEGIAMIAAAFYPKPVIVRLSDFKSNEYANLIGGSNYEPKEENPMLGFRGASRYVAENFFKCFELECIALKRVREEMGFLNVEIMIPFVRTVLEAKNVIALLKMHGLERGKDKLRLIMMCEIPSNALLAEEFLEHFDGFSIGSNDLTQLTLGLDRDSSLVASQFDERDPAVKALLHMAIAACKKNNKYIGICGQGPSDHSDFAIWLAKEGVDSLSLNPDSVLATHKILEEALMHE